MKNPFSKKNPTVSNEPATAKPKRFSRKQQLIATGVIVALLISGIAYAALYQGRDEAIAADRITDLTPSHFSTTVSATGEVLADKDVDIYTTQTAPIEEIFVEEGEKVEQGQVLAKLDDKKLRQQIRQREAAAGVSARSAAAQVNAARNRYNAAARALQNGTNGAIVSAGSALASAKYAWDAAEKTYRDMKRSIDEGYNPELTNEASGKSRPWTMPNSVCSKPKPSSPKPEINTMTRSTMPPATTRSGNACARNGTMPKPAYPSSSGKFLAIR